MTTVSIPAGEIGVIRVFAVNRAIPTMKRAIASTGKSAVAAELCGQPLTENGYEIFPVSDLTGVGLPTYLTDGFTVPADEIANDRGRLDALDGYVLIVFSSAFEGASASLTFGADLTLIGTYGEARAKMAATTIESSAAQPYTGTPRTPPAAPPKGPPGSAMVVLGLIVLLGLLAWWMLT